jgi:MFS transporter, DHA2 family, multidrug resistance protein
VAWELRTSSPMLDVRLFRVRRFSGASLSIGLVFFSLFGAIFFLTMYLQEVKDYDPLSAGLRITPVAIGLVLGGPASAKLAGRIGTRIVVAAGLTIVASARLLMSGADADTGYGLIAASLVLMGFGMGTTMAPATESIMSSLPLAHAGVGSAMNDTVRLVGGTLGVAILGSLLSGQYGADMEAAAKDLPEPARAAAEGSIGGASAVAERIGGHAGATLSNAAESAYTAAMGTTLLVAAAVALAGAVVALVVLPGREREHAEKRAVAAELVPA